MRLDLPSVFLVLWLLVVNKLLCAVFPSLIEHPCCFVFQLKILKNIEILRLLVTFSLIYKTGVFEDDIQKWRVVFDQVSKAGNCPLLDACLLAYLSWQSISSSWAFDSLSFHPMAKSRIDRAENAYRLFPWVSVNYRGELVRRDGQKGGGRGEGVPQSSKYNSNKTVFKYPFQKYLRYGHYLRP